MRSGVMAPKPGLTCTNITQNIVIASQVRKADNYFKRLVGLLSCDHLETGEGLWIIPCREIHSIGMRFEFDALFLDKDLNVVHTIERMRPFRVSPVIREARTVLELDGGVIETTGTRVGDQLEFT